MMPVFNFKEHGTMRTCKKFNNTNVFCFNNCQEANRNMKTEKSNHTKNKK